MAIPKIVGMIVSMAISYFTNKALLKKKSKAPTSVDDRPQSTTTRGAALPLLIGRSRIGPVIAWLTGRTVGGGGTVSESAGHLICVGPVDKLHRIFRNGQTVWQAPITPEEYPSGSTLQTTDTKQQSFTIYWGEEDPVVSGAPASMGSNLPYVCYITWNNVDLTENGGVWDEYTYDIEALPSAPPETGIITEVNELSVQEQKEDGYEVAEVLSGNPPTCYAQIAGFKKGEDYGFFSANKNALIEDPNPFNFLAEMTPVDPDSVINSLGGDAYRLEWIDNGLYRYWKHWYDLRNDLPGATNPFFVELLLQREGFPTADDGKLWPYWFSVSLHRISTLPVDEEFPTNVITQGTVKPGTSGWEIDVIKTFSDTTILVEDYPDDPQYQKISFTMVNSNDQEVGSDYYFVVSANVGFEGVGRFYVDDRTQHQVKDMKVDNAQEFDVRDVQEDNGRNEALYTQNPDLDGWTFTGNPFDYTNQGSGYPTILLPPGAEYYFDSNLAYTWNDNQKEFSGEFRMDSLPVGFRLGLKPAGFGIPYASVDIQIDAANNLTWTASGPEVESFTAIDKGGGIWELSMILAQETGLPFTTYDAELKLYSISAVATGAISFGDVYFGLLFPETFIYMNENLSTRWESVGPLPANIYPITAGSSGGIGGPTGAGILYQLLFSPYPHGVGQDVNYFDIDSLATVSASQNTERLVMSALADEGRDAEAMIAMLLQDAGVMMFWDYETGKYVFRLIRDTEDTTEITIPRDQYFSEPAMQINHDDSEPNQISFGFKDVNRKFRETTIIRDDDSLVDALYSNTKRTQMTRIPTVIDFETAKSVAERRSQEQLGYPSPVKVKAYRDTRVIKPGDRMTLESLPNITFMVTGIKPVANTDQNEISGMVDSYRVPKEAGGESDTPTDPLQIPENDLQIRVFELPKMLADGMDQVVPLRIRAHGGIIGADVYYSKTGSSYAMDGQHVGPITGGLLNEPLTKDTYRVIENGPIINYKGPDILDMITLAAFQEFSGINMAIIDDEIIYFRELEIINTLQARIKGMVRARKGTDLEDHAAGSEIYLVQEADILQGSSLSISQGETIYLKTTPKTEQATLPLEDSQDAVVDEVRALYSRDYPILHGTVDSNRNQFVEGQNFPYLVSYRNALPGQSNGIFGQTFPPNRQFTWTMKDYYDIVPGTATYITSDAQGTIPWSVISAVFGVTIPDVLEFRVRYGNSEETTINYKFNNT